MSISQNVMAIEQMKILLNIVSELVFTCQNTLADNKNYNGLQNENEKETLFNPLTKKESMIPICDLANNYIK